MTPELTYIKNTLKKIPLNVFMISHQVNNYLSVIKLWNNYKIHYKKINGKTQFYQDYTIRCILKFHLEDTNHIIMYHSKHLDEILIMCKNNNKYFNMKIPYMQFKNDTTYNNEKLKKMKKTSFVAIYK